MRDLLIPVILLVTLLHPWQVRSNQFDLNRNLFGAKKAISSSDTCFCKLEGTIDDCLCNVDTVDYFNNMKIFPRLQSLLIKPYFRYFQYNARKPCPYWDSTLDKCANSNCGVKSCGPDEIPPGLKGQPVHNHHNVNKYTKEAQETDVCSDDVAVKTPEGKHIDSKVDDTISDSARKDLEKWKDHDNSQATFCDVDAEQCPDCDYVDLALNPERFTGYANEPAHRIWRAIYEENCFTPPNKQKNQKHDEGFSAAFLQDTLEDLCLEKRAFYRAISGLHSSITIHLCANYLLTNDLDSPFSKPEDKWGPNLDEFQRRFDPVTTKGQGPYWLRNVYFVYLLELRALMKVAPYLESQSFYTGNDEEDKDTQIAVKELLNLVKSFPDHFDESVMFNGGTKSAESLKKEFREHFHNITLIMDCVGCDKCKLWGKLQITGLGTALKILFSEGKSKPNVDLTKMAEELQRLQPPPPVSGAGTLVDMGDIKLTRNEIVALFNAFGRISTSIRQLEKFREMLRKG